MDLLKFRADDRLFLLVVKAKSRFTKEIVDEFLGMTRVKCVFKDFGKVGTNSSVEAVVQVRRDEGLKSGEEGFVENIA